MSRQSVATEAGEFPVMTNGAGLFVGQRSRAAVRFEKLWTVGIRPQRGVSTVALLATERGLDFGVTHETVGHLREGGGGNLVGRDETTMAGGAFIRLHQLMSESVSR